MLSKAQMVRVRRNIEQGYTHSCTISIKEEHMKPNRSTGFRNKIVVENQPCRLSFSSSKTSQSDGNISVAEQTIKLFIAPELIIPAGSNITIIHDGIETEYTKSGQPAIYPTHQEILLEIKERET